MAPEYKVRIHDHHGTLVGELVDWQELNYSKLVNEVGAYSLTLRGDAPQVALFELDGIVEVWRRNPDPDYAIDWYIDYAGFHRTVERSYTKESGSLFTSEGADFKYLLDGRYTIWPADRDAPTKTGRSETVAKEYVDEACVSSVAIRQYPGFAVETSGNHGEDVEISDMNTLLLTTLQKLTTWAGSEGAEAVGDFDVVQTGTATVGGVPVPTFEFRWYDLHLGEDRTVGNIYGNAPVTFSLALGNMASPTLRIDAMNEKTLAWAGGKGKGNARVILGANATDRLLSSPFNSREMWVNASPEDTDGVEAMAFAELSKNQVVETFEFSVLQIPGCAYGKHYFLGDLITARYEDVERDKKIVAVTVTVSVDKGGEKIEVKTGDV